MNLKCLFGHTWNGCTCTKCGKARPVAHDQPPIGATHSQTSATNRPLGSQFWPEAAEDVFAGSVEQLNQALSHLADINAVLVPTDGYTALHLAAKTGDVEKIKAILERKPNLEIHSNNRHFTPLHTSVINNHSDAVKVLVDAGADIEARANDGLTSLHLASMKGLSDVTYALILCHADVHATESTGSTPLHAAAYYGHLEVASKLLFAGHANPLRKDKAGNTPLQLARGRGHNEIASLCDREALFHEPSLSLEDIGSLGSRRR